MIETPPGVTRSATAWDGVWRGEFGARSDFAITVRGGAVVAMHMLGQPVAILRSQCLDSEVSIISTDGSITLKRGGPHSAQGTYVNNAGKKATALFERLR